MDAPPPKPVPKQASEGLAEVERALSVLKGRHPEHERVQREDEERRSKRKVELEAVQRQELRRTRRKQLVIGSAVASGVVVVLGLGLAFRSEIQRRGRLEQAADPYRAVGFSLVESSSRGEPNKVEANVPAGCIVAASVGPAQVRVALGAGTVEGPSPVVTCSCEGATVTVTTEPSRGDGLVLLRADAPALGGSRAFAFLPFKPGAVGASDAACAEGSLDAWLEARRWSEDAVSTRGGAPRPAAPVDQATSDRWLGQGNRGGLRDAGFKVGAIVKPDAPFSVVEVPGASCMLVVADDPADKPSVRSKGGALTVGPAVGNLAWCAASEAVVLVQRGADAKASGEITVLVGPAARVGGLSGLHDVAARAGIELAASGVASGDHGWNAKQLLVASGIPDTLVGVSNAPDLSSDAEARIVAVSLDKANTVSSEAPDGVFSYCDPPLENARSALCIFSGKQKWGAHAAGPGAAGIASAKLPFWLFALQGVSDPPALKLEAQLLGFSRRLVLVGFEPTTIEAVTDTDKGAEVLGRANEDAMVVLGLAPTEPWVFPYTDGPAWTIDGDPHIVPIKPLERVQVTATPTSKLPPKATRRTVVFRRHKR
jgi:hypothetical protein